MKKLFFTLFTAISLGLGYTQANAMDKSDKTDIVALSLDALKNILPSLTDLELTEGIIKLVYAPFVPNSGAANKIILIMNAIDTRQIAVNYGVDDKSANNLLSNIITKTFAFKSKMIEWFLRHGARVDARDDRGYTPLMTTLNSPDKNEEVIELLLKYGANQNIQLKDVATGALTTPRQVAESQRTQSNAASQQRMKLLDRYNTSASQSSTVSHPDESLAQQMRRGITEAKARKAAQARKTAQSTVTPAQPQSESTQSADDIASLFTNTEEPTPLEQLCNEPDSTNLMDLLLRLRLTPTQALLRLIRETTNGSGINMEEKINYLISWHKNNKPNIGFNEQDNIYLIVRNYGKSQGVFEKKYIQSVPAWIEWFIQHGPKKLDGSPIIVTREQGSVIDLAISYGNPAAVAMLINYGQKPTDDAILYAYQRADNNTLAVLPQNQVARVVEQERTAAAKRDIKLLPQQAATSTSETRELTLLPEYEEKSPTPVSQTSNTLPPTTPGTQSSSFYQWLQNRQTLSAIAGVIAVYSGYRWFTSSPKAEITDDVVFNNTGTDLMLMTEDNIYKEPTKGGTTISLPPRGSITIETSDKARNTIDLDQFTQKRNTHYLNIIVTKRRWVPGWLSSWVSPLTYSIRWIEKE